VLLSDIQQGGEVWRKVRGASEYEVSNYGKVRRDGRLRRVDLHDGQGSVQLTVNGVRVEKRISTLVAEAFEVRPTKSRKSSTARRANQRKAAKIREAVAARRDAYSESRKHYRNATAYIPNDGHHREPGNFKVLRNYAPTVIDGWFDERETEFTARDIRVISVCCDHWRALDEAAYERRTMRGFVPTKAFIRALKVMQARASRVPSWQWYVFENVVRWDEPVGIPGSKFASNSRASVSAAKQVVKEVARSIA
jgi:hypothetical protein